MPKMIPTPRILQGYRSKKWQAPEAIAELVDNSFGEDRGNATQVDIWWDRNTRTMRVLDNGRGMENVNYLFQLGRGVASSGGSDIGRYGQGGSEALLWLPDEVDVWSLRDGVVAHTKQDIAQVVDVDEDWLDVDPTYFSASPASTPPELLLHGSGTLISMKLRRGKHITPRVVQDRLSVTYSAALRNGKRIVWHDLDDIHHPITAWDPGELGTEVPIALMVRGMRVDGSVALAPGVTERDAGVAVTFGHRQILKSREPIGGYRGGGVYGWVHLAKEWLPFLSTNKDDINDQDLKGELFRAIEHEVAPLIDLLDERETDRFAADLSFEANMKFGAVAQRLVNQFPVIERMSDHPPRPIVKNDPPRPAESPGGGLPIDVRPERAGLDGRYLTVSLDRAQGKVVVLFDPKAELVIEARQSKPTNVLLFRYMISEEFSRELIREDLVVAGGLYTVEEWDSLLDRYGDDLVSLTSYVTPKLYERVLPA